MKPPQKLLVIVTRRIGDVLLATPLIRSLKRAWPEARIDALVFENTEGLLLGNPDLHEIITVPQRPTIARHLALLRRIWRSYDLAISTLTGDRPTFYAFAAGRHRVGTLESDANSRWKRRLLHRWVPFDNLQTHTVVMNLRLAQVLGVEPRPEVVVGWRDADELAVAARLSFDTRNVPFALLHVYPNFVYKAWHDQGWVELIDWLAGRGMKIVLTGGKAADELAYINALLPRLPSAIHNLAGQLSLSEVACVASRAALYVGPDTAITHLAAALRVPTVALFGPSNPVKWGPWPGNFRKNENPWQMRGTQHVENVALVQGETDCVPCLEEGCERHVRSLSDCLQHMPAAKVIAAVQRVLGESAPTGARVITLRAIDGRGKGASH